MNKMIEDGCLPDGGRLIGEEHGSELVSSECAERDAGKTKNTRDLRGKLHKRGMMAVGTALFNSPGNFAAPASDVEDAGGRVLLFSD
jgi:hypothetical protein